MPRIEAIVTPMGAIITYDGSMPGLKKLPNATVRRVSWVYPAGYGKRCCFFLLRRLFGDDGRVAKWTHDWRGSWFVDFAPSADVAAEIGLPPMTLFQSRQAALAFEGRYVPDVLLARFAELHQQSLI